MQLCATFGFCFKVEVSIGAVASTAVILVASTAVDLEAALAVDVEDQDSEIEAAEVALEDADFKSEYAIHFFESYFFSIF